MMTSDMIKPWWRSQEQSDSLTDAEQYLVQELTKAHRESCFRPNVSTEAVLGAAAGSGSLTSAIAAALMTTGFRHAPVYDTVMFLSLDDPAEVVKAILEAGKKVPGWGGAFQKTKPDPIWTRVDTALLDYNPPLHAKICSVTSELGKHGKFIYPNPSCYTAAVAITLQMPPALAVYLFILGRLDGWCQLALNEI